MPGAMSEMHVSVRFVLVIVLVCVIHCLYQPASHILTGITRRAVVKTDLDVSFLVRRSWKPRSLCKGAGYTSWLHFRKGFHALEHWKPLYFGGLLCKLVQLMAMEWFRMDKIAAVLEYRCSKHCLHCLFLHNVLHSVEVRLALLDLSSVCISSLTIWPPLTALIADVPLLQNTGS